MKPITIHPGSALIGAVSLSIVVVAAGATQRGATALGQVVGPEKQPARIEIANPSELRDGIDARNAVFIPQEAGPFTVPDGKILMLTGIGVRDGSTVALVQVDGATRIRICGLCDPQPIPPGFTIRSGSTLQLAGGDNPRVWGYLVDA